MTISAAPPGAPNAPPGSIRELVKGYRREVAQRKKLGDSRAEYHAQAWKHRGYKLLIDSGYSPKDAVAAWKAVALSLELRKSLPDNWNGGES